MPPRGRKLERLTGATVGDALRPAAVARARWIPENGTQLWLFEANLAKALADLKWAFGGKNLFALRRFGHKQFGWWRPIGRSTIHRYHYPPIWRRLHVPSDSSIAMLHDLLQIAFDWSDFHLHRFVIRGKEYDVNRMGCTTFTTDARKVLLSQFRFRVNERFLYEYDFGDLWQHQIRFEGVQPIRGKKIYPVCVGGAGASPPEDCGGSKVYMKKIDHHRWNPPLDELQLIADAVGRVLDSHGHERIRDVLGDVDALEEAVDRLETYKRFQPVRFDRRKLNRRLKQYAQGDEEWLWE